MNFWVVGGGEGLVERRKRVLGKGKDMGKGKGRGVEDGRREEGWGGGGGEKLVVLDMPGYGHGSHAEWGEEIEKYLEGRKQLKRVFLLVDASHGLKSNDVEALTLFRKLGVSHQVILSKADRVLDKGKKSKASAEGFQRLGEVVEALRPVIQPGGGDGPEAVGEVIACSAERGFGGPGVGGGRFGVEEVRWATLVAAGLGGGRRGGGELLKRQVDEGGERRIVSQEDLVVEEEEEEGEEAGMH